MVSSELNEVTRDTLCRHPPNEGANVRWMFGGTFCEPANLKVRSLAEDCAPVNVRRGFIGVAGPWVKFWGDP